MRLGGPADKSEIKGLGMSFGKFKGWFLVGLGALVILAEIILVTSNWGDPCTFHFYTHTVTNFSVGQFMLACATGGLVFGLMVWLLLRGIKDLLRARKIADAKIVLQADKKV